ncbi:protein DETOXIFICATION 36-like [Vigna unguiculata]|uniref:protein DETOXIFICATION 36-like n=1 Tax=Vigna unguiculata TaxID=3917 RepID=UPI00101708FA|nr:protein DETOXIFICATION 36-like [Vigna unguiculata]
MEREEELHEAFLSSSHDDESSHVTKSRLEEVLSDTTIAFSKRILSATWIEFDLLFLLAGPAIIVYVINNLMSLLGMGSAVETLCGQAYRANKHEMLVVYMQRAIIVLVVTGIPLTVAYIFCEPILLLLGEPPELASVAAVFVYGLIPQIFGYAVNFPYRSFCRRRVWWCQALTYETDFRIRVECWKRILESINTQNLSMKF